MSWFRFPWLCKFFGHRLILINDLREGRIKRQRVVYRCLRCKEPVIIRAIERRNKERRQSERRSIPGNTNDRRRGQRRGIYSPANNLAHLLHS